MSISTTAFWTLSVLASGPHHGYGILKSISELSNETVDVRVGALYRTIDRLESDGRIEVDHRETVDGRERTYYRLTPKGHSELESSLHEMQMMTAVAETRLRKTTFGEFGIRPTTMGIL
ncbi:unannotated protein [freshwater metagenome]|uniref:Unannotated protein n=1 Tax=freshwater metagenome TaxID=449393 RepID=A0A6J6X624_9ZZZZ|nr:PadR family transcriptional regulator [Actinomycetota bacterium]MSY34291.1 PadR family transcriptional regulator [Actinomycetota bacterium]MTB22900.1 PadR family transcriptional regulator [Actinomycetota bacterium]